MNTCSVKIHLSKPCYTHHRFHGQEHIQYFPIGISGHCWIVLQTKIVESLCKLLPKERFQGMHFFHKAGPACTVMFLPHTLVAANNGWSRNHAIGCHQTLIVLIITCDDTERDRENRHRDNPVFSITSLFKVFWKARISPSWIPGEIIRWLALAYGISEKNECL